VLGVIQVSNSKGRILQYTTSARGQFYTNPEFMRPGASGHVALPG
jgi:hypothetical protein